MPSASSASCHHYISACCNGSSIVVGCMLIRNKKTAILKMLYAIRMGWATPEDLEGDLDPLGDNDAEAT